MIVLVCGGSGCGKSAYAEKRIMELHGHSEGCLFYLATMKVYGEEGKKKVERHRKLREKKNMTTLEQCKDVAGVMDQCGLRHEDALLLEDMGNLVANEMFSEFGDIIPADRVAHKVIGDVRAVAGRVGNLVIVTNNVFEDDLEYEDGTKQYMQALGDVNRAVAAMADEVVEMVVGIPVFHHPESIREGHD